MPNTAFYDRVPFLRHPTDGSESIYRIQKKLDRTTLRHSGNGSNDSQAFRKGSKIGGRNIREITDFHWMGVVEGFGKGTFWSKVAVTGEMTNRGMGRGIPSSTMKHSNPNARFWANENRGVIEGLRTVISHFGGVLGQ
jgi:hypothetical protein